MDNLIYVLEHECSNIHGLELNPLDVIDTQKSLIENKIIPIPNSFINFLEKFNGINYHGGEIFGIRPPKRLAGDILEVNLKQERLLKSNYLFLGVDEFDYLVYNKEKNLYQIIDKVDLEVLEEYADVVKAISYILKV